MQLETVTKRKQREPRWCASEELKKTLAADIPEEAGHAQQHAALIKKLGGLIGSS